MLKCSTTFFVGFVGTAFAVTYSTLGSFQTGLWNMHHYFLWFYSQYLSTVIPYRPSDGRPTVERLRVYLTCTFCCVC